jgi:serine/threonine-protein kinase HipA
MGGRRPHILKPTDRWPYSAENEALTMHLARVAGLTPAPTWVEVIAGTSVLVAERYDRRVEGTEVVRRHQEDFCQALGMRPGEKYHIGRPSERMARLLLRMADAPIPALEGLFRQVAFRAVVGDEDGHGKNYSLLLDGGGVELAPLYDSLCTLAYPELSGRMATPIGRQSSLARVDREALLDEARAMRVPSSVADEVLQALAADLRVALAGLDASLTSGWPSATVVETIAARIDRLERGQSMGGAATKTSSRRSPRRADDMTALTNS